MKFQLFETGIVLLYCVNILRWRRWNYRLRERDASRTELDQLLKNIPGEKP